MWRKDLPRLVLGSNFPSSSIDGQLSLFSGTSGQSLKAATGSGYLKATSGVLAYESSPFPVGFVADYFGNIAPSGWLLLDGTSIGNASSGGTGRANSDTQTLFELIWNSTTNTEITIQDSAGNPTTRGASATIDFNANKRIPFPDMRGRSSIGAGTGSGLTNRPLGGIVGAETHTLSSSELAIHNHSVDPPATTSGGVSVGHTHAIATHSSSAEAENYGLTKSANFVNRVKVAATGDNTETNSADHTHSVDIASFNSGNSGSGNAHNNMQPSGTFTKIIKY